MKISESVEFLKQNLCQNLSSEILELNRANGKILSREILAKRNSPVFSNSALDGYAYNDISAGLWLEILPQTIFAGDKKDCEIKENESIKIMTGAPMPKGANCVIRLEDAVIENEQILVPKTNKKNDGNRQMGEEFQSGEILLKKGEKLSAKKILLLASQGISAIEVFKSPKIAVFSSGNELKNPGENTDNFEIYDANSHGICELLKQNGLECENFGILKDEPKSLKFSLQNALKTHDVIITSGGASVGEKDFMCEILATLGFEKIINGVEIKPGGKPTKCFKKGDKTIFVLPGNPLASYILCFLVVLPILKFLSGENFEFQGILATYKGENINFKKPNLLFGNLNGENFEISVKNFNSYMLTPLVKSSYIYICETLTNGEKIKILKID